MSPFPGIDPYIESQNLWLDFHHRFITALGDVLSERLPEPYVARIDERLNLVEYPGDVARLVLPDVAIVRQRPVPQHERPEPSGGTATLEPITIPLAILEEQRESSIEIWHGHGRERRLVTAIELLSPTNKAGAGLRDYLAKRNALIRQDINLVELDFLIAGRRLPMEAPLPAGEYFAFVAPGDRRPDCNVYPWTVRDPLPVIPIPLLPPDPAIELDLGPIFRGVYHRARYARSIDYNAPLTLPLPPETRAWAETRARTPTG